MKILFALPHPGHVRTFELPIRELGRREHLVHLAFSGAGKQTQGHELDDVALAALERECPWLTHERAPVRMDWWRPFARAARNSLDYLRYVEPRFARAQRLRDRAASQAPDVIRWLIAAAGSRSVPFARALSRLLRAVERAIPTAANIDSFVRRHDPDVVLVTPLVDIGSEEVEYVKSALRLGYRSCLCVASWDNLTNKGLVRILPDKVIVWNETQAREAVELHGVPCERVVVTGAPRFDEWFDRRPSRGRAQFCAQLGLDPTRPLLLYVCSSASIATEEVAFVRGWLERIRAATDPSLAQAGVIVRPHPQNVRPWRAADALHDDATRVWPLEPFTMLDESARSDYFDSLFHSAAVVGINTSALIEAAIVDRPVHTLIASEFAEGQNGTLHFGYLSDERLGVLHVARSFEEHVAQLALSIARQETGSARNRAFVTHFVRPCGLDRPATPIFCDAIERLADTPAGHL